MSDSWADDPFEEDLSDDGVPCDDDADRVRALREVIERNPADASGLATLGNDEAWAALKRLGVN